MHTRLLVRSLFCATLLAAACLRGEEQNAWPFFVRQENPAEQTKSAQYIGPLFFAKSDPVLGEVSGLRPIVLQAKEGNKETSAFLYPLFKWEQEPDYSNFTFFLIINRRRVLVDQQVTERRFDIWPLYFSKETGNPATSDHALFPIAGTLRQRVGRDRITWFLFPLYMNSETSGMEVTSMPWPIVRVIQGNGHHGFELWPLFGRRGREGDYDKQFYLWPLFYKSARDLSAPQPSVSIGALPFYARDTAPGLRSETFLWPFFGYTHRTQPFHYDEQRYFWPFLVQAKGDQRSINRWMPFYSHSLSKGYDKTWVMWPLFRHAEWTDADLAEEKNQVLFFVYWNRTQRSLTNPAAAPAHKTHLWPLFSAWDNGAGRRQLQVLSPFEVFFQSNDLFRQLYTPLFALYRYDRTDDQASRHSLLWDAITYRRTPTGKEFNLGPLLSVRSAPDGRKRVAFGVGLIGWQRTTAGARGRLFLFDFKSKPAITAPSGAPSP